MIFAFGSIVIAHCYRMFSDYEGWHQDFTGSVFRVTELKIITRPVGHSGVELIR